MNITSILLDPDVQTFSQSQHLLTNSIEHINERLFQISLAIGVVGQVAHEVAGIKDVRTISRDGVADVLQFTFLDYVSFAVTSETFAQRNDAEIRDGTRICVYTKSFFLDFVRNSTGATSDFPGELFHVQINTLDHTIDVVTPHRPEISVIPSGYRSVPASLTLN